MMTRRAGEFLEADDSAECGLLRRAGTAAGSHPVEVQGSSAANFRNFSTICACRSSLGDPVE